MQCSFCFPDLEESLLRFPPFTVSLIPIELFLIHIGLGTSPLVRDHFIFHIRDFSWQEKHFSAFSISRHVSTTNGKEFFFFPFWMLDLESNCQKLLIPSHILTMLITFFLSFEHKNWELSKNSPFFQVIFFSCRQKWHSSRHRQMCSWHLIWVF